MRLLHLFSLVFLSAVVLLISNVNVVSSANILFYFGWGSYSHRLAVWPYVLKLAELGHQITVVCIWTAKPEHSNIPNITEFMPIPNSDDAFKLDVFNLRAKGGRLGSWRIVPELSGLGYEVCRMFLEANGTDEWIRSSKFDLVVVDPVYNECGLALAYKFNAKVIVFATSTLYSWTTDSLGIIQETSVLSDSLIAFTTPMTFWQRVISTCIPLLEHAQKYWVHYPKLDALFQKHLNDTNMPSVGELEKKTELVLLGTWYTEEYPRSLPPFVVSVGGIHLESVGSRMKEAKVPKEIGKWMDESGSNGFVYVSFGSIARTDAMSPNLLATFLTAFKNTNTRFLWKWDGPPPSGVPENVLTADWMPQQSILSHPKIKGFITHCGLLSLIEAMRNGVPVIMFPVFAEQDFNAFRYEREGRGIRLELSDLEPDQLQHAISEILTNPSYKENMLQTKELYEDRPMSPMKTAIWWTEFVLRHRNLTKLKPLTMDQAWYERRLLDVYGFLAVFLLSCMVVTLFLAWKMLGVLFRRIYVKVETKYSLASAERKVKKA